MIWAVNQNQLSPGGQVATYAPLGLKHNVTFTVHKDVDMGIIHLEPGW